MSKNTALNKSHSPESDPLQALADILQEDMRAVNQAILANMQSSVPLIPELAQYLIAAGGKRIRPLLTLACTRIFDAETPRPYGLAASVEFIHSATLLHDDVVDGSELRRGQKAANLVFGNQASVLVGDYLFSRAFQLMVADGSLEVLRILSDASAIIAEGEVLQLSTQNNLETSFDDYLKVIESKTAALFAAACEIGPVIANQDTRHIQALREYGMALGIAFQLVDDLLDYSAAQEKLGKAIGDDFHEGKMTLPIFLLKDQGTQDDQDFLRRTFQDKNIKDGDLTYLQSRFRDLHIFSQGDQIAKEYAQKALNSLSSLPDHPLKSLLGDAVLFTVERDF